MRGFYRMDFTGRAGQGTGALAFVEGKIAGVDGGGGIYIGEYTTLENATVSGSVDLSFPQGGVLATSGEAVPAGGGMRIPFTVENDQIDGGILKIQTPSGPVNVRLTQISGL